MRTKKPILTWLAVWVVAMLLLSCSLQGIPFLPSQGTPSVLASPTVLPTTPPTTFPLEVSPLPPTPVPAPALAHFTSGQKITITYIHMVDSNRGWGLGGVLKSSDHVFRTRDGGQTWQDLTPPQPTADQGSQWQNLGFFLDFSSAWVMYFPPAGGPPPQSVLIWYTHDGAASWQSSQLDTSAFQEFFSPSHMVFVDSQHGWVLAHVGVGMNHDYVAVLATTDGGISWQVLLDPTRDGGIQSCPKNGMAFADAQTGWLTPDCNGVDPSPHLFHTLDGGATWARLDLPAPAGAPDLFNNNDCGMHSPFLFSATYGVFGMKCLDHATYKVEKDYLYWTSDGGKSWQTATYPGGDLFFFSPQQGLALGRVIQTTTDAGHSWSIKSSVTWDGQFSFVDPNLVWAVATGDLGALAMVKGVVNNGKWDGSWDIVRPLVAP